MIFPCAFRAWAPPLRFAAIGLLAMVSFAPAVADIVTRRDGGTVEGMVVRVDAESVMVKTSGGTVRIARTDVASIDFAAPAPPVKVEMRNVRSDDAIDVLLYDEVVLRGEGPGGEWVDLTPKLKNGNNPLRLRIHNARSTWAYQLSLRINGRVTSLSCGTPLRSDDPCRCCGLTGWEQGIVDDLPEMWIYVDRELGTAELVE